MTREATGNRASSWRGTALEWMEHCETVACTQQQCQQQVDNDDNGPTSSDDAAECLRTGKFGISFVDEALKRSNSRFGPAQVVEVVGSPGKTWTLLTMLARYIVATRTAKFSSTQKTTNENQRPHGAPIVVWLDSMQDLYFPNLVRIVRAALLRDLTEEEILEHQHDGEDRLMSDLKSCLDRIHLVPASSRTCWVALLESLRIATQQQTSVLLCWDNFLLDLDGAEAHQQEVIRQIQRLLKNDNVWLVAAVASSFSTVVNSSSSGRRLPSSWEKIVDTRIRLEPKYRDGTDGGHSHIATVIPVSGLQQQSSAIPFSISKDGAGILS